MQYAPTLTDQKIDFLLSIELPARYILGRMQYAPTLTGQKFNSIPSIESPTRYILGRMQYAPTLTDQNWIPFYLLNRPPDALWITRLYGLSIPGEKLLKFV